MRTESGTKPALATYMIPEKQPQPERTLPELVASLEAIAADVELKSLTRRSLHAVGMAPAYMPDEIIDASGALPVHLYGGSPSFEVVRGDAFFQSAICHLPRSLLELAFNGSLDPLDLIVIPSTCDVLRNLTGMWRVMFPTQPVHFLELPQRSDESGVSFFRGELMKLADAVADATGCPIQIPALNASIARFNKRRRALSAIEDLRRESPLRAPASELYLLLRAGAALTPQEHLNHIDEYLALSRATPRKQLDVARVVVTGSFCEAPPVGFIRALERAGCAVVADDFLSGSRWLDGPVSENQDDPFRALAAAYASLGSLAPCRFEGASSRAETLLQRVRSCGAQGVILTAPSFCDPALLDQPRLVESLERAGVPSIQLQYSENSVDYASVREQAGTFADALRLWEAA